eukprot:1150842-Pelagomonas_calceolata.AAC.3
MQPMAICDREPAQSDITLDSETCSRAHCALVHHQDGRLFLIDLGERTTSSTHGTQLDGKPVPANKPTNLKNGAVLSGCGTNQLLPVRIGRRFGHLSTAFVVRVESSAPATRTDGLRFSLLSKYLSYSLLRTCICPSAEKRGASGQEEEPSKRTNIMHVRASHLLVKHRDSRRPSSWKVGEEEGRGSLMPAALQEHPKSKHEHSSSPVIAQIFRLPRTQAGPTKVA